jgi:hypothetical protein
MATAELSSPRCRSTQSIAVVRAVPVIMGTVVGLAFLFGFGHVLNLALHLGVPDAPKPIRRSARGKVQLVRRLLLVPVADLVEGRRQCWPEAIAP